MELNSIFRWNVHGPLKRLGELNTHCNAKLRHMITKQTWSESDRENCLELLSQLFINRECVVDICCCLSPLVLEIASRAVKSVLKKGKHALKKFAVSLSQGLPVSTELRRFAVDFMKIHKPLCCEDSPPGMEPSAKKTKKSKISDLEWCKAMYVFVTHLPQICDLLDFSGLPDHLSHSDPLIRWLAASTLSKHFNMTEEETTMFFRKYFTDAENRQLALRVATDLSDLRKRAQQFSNMKMLDVADNSSSNLQTSVVSSDLSTDVVSVMGILLPKISSSDKTDVTIQPLVPVSSTQHHLRSLSLAVSTGQPVLLQGPVGCGKTSMVEHLAAQTGRTGAPHFLKIQLGDQTDSKALLGTYCSTEVPGEFVWRAGVLTQAVIKGGWVLLEDIDTAPMDILSLLVALAETGSLTIPGHGDEVQAAPGFQLFTTIRLLSSSDGVFNQKRGNTAILEKLCCVVNVEPLSREELKQVIAVRFPALHPISDKLLNIYFSLSASDHDQGEADGEFGQEGVVKRAVLPSLGGRLISTRDLMSWCRRSCEDFDLDGPLQGLKVFQEALDCFVTCLASLAKRQTLAVAIGNRLNVPEERAKFFNSEYKPTIQDHATGLEVGRGKLTKKKQTFGSKYRRVAPVFSYTRSSVMLLEKVCVCVRHNEPVLLVGETGTGKTSTIQFLAHHLGHKLHVINLNQQSDSTDLLGGFKPVDFRILVMPLREEFEGLFCNTFSRGQNEKFLSHIQTLFLQKRWHDLLSLMEAPIPKAMDKFSSESQECSKWAKVSRRINELRLQLKEAENVLAFSFIEGTLVRALRNGDWVLLDEINLAAAETLDCLSGLLESGSGSVVLTERGDSKPITRHPNFRLFACMNPATDVGKKDLPVGIRNRFIEFFVAELECKRDLSTLVRDYLPGLSLSSKQVTGIVQFYLSIKNDPSDKLKDGTGHKPHFSLRTLCRSLRYAGKNPCGSIPRSLFEGFCLSFLTQLDRSSHPAVESLICKHILAGSSVKSVLGQKIPPPDSDVTRYVHVADYWISKGQLEPSVPGHYIITPSVKMNLKDLCRVVAAGNHPVLLQGETSVGKTSLITYLAQLTGNVCVRVNNHEHTDLQEYIGCYAADEHGKLAFREGVLVEAMRKGHWIILDELNLAPSDVLEALNRLLDDNQELFIPETQEVVHAHPKFQLFATQNPPGLYGGRKVLSRAFRNRFIELHFDEIPPKELETILHERCGIPLSYAKKLVAVMLELQTRRSGSGIFFGKQGFMTLRDLFRWAQRYNCPDTGKGEKFYDWDQHLADHGYMLLAGRVRKPEEEEVIKEVIGKHMKRQVSHEHLFSVTSKTSVPLTDLLTSVMTQTLSGFEHIVWTHSMRRLAVLIGQAIRFREPVLLVGDTGVGKTTVCQLYAAMEGLRLHIVNCHMHSESADFLGGLRPLRSHEADEEGENKLFEWKDGPLVQAMREGSMFLIDEISLADDSVLERLNSVLEPERTLLLAERGGVGEGYGETEVEKIVAQEKFHVFATMNPGGDFGKKELSPALRNRFTEIWCPQATDRTELQGIIDKNILPGLQLYNTQDGTSGFGKAILDFIEWFTGTEFGRRVTVSIRDILSWVSFINTSHDKLSLGDKGKEPFDLCGFGCADDLRMVLAYLHGACLVFVDSLGAGTLSFSTTSSVQMTRQTCINFLLKQIHDLTGTTLDVAQTGLSLTTSCGGDKFSTIVTVDENKLVISPFSIDRGAATSISQSVDTFSLHAPTTCANAQRVLRGLQLHRPILLEGSPGVGKTSLVAAIARVARRTLVRINLSEQTDVTDLFGADLPVEGQEGGRFAWRDGPFLQALKAGHWVVFDELNLASQSVLEGLNACFDHRGEVYVPELGKTFQIEHASTRIFACQNPLAQGGGRKGLPKSFLNRFTQVFVDPLSHDDLRFILSCSYPEFPAHVLNAMVQFNSKIFDETMVARTWALRGSPWEFNLRDLFRWCDVLKANQCMDSLNPGEFVSLIYCDRMRTEADKTKVLDLFRSVCGDKYPLYQSSRLLHVGRSTVQMGHSFLAVATQKETRQPCQTSDYYCLPLHHSLEPLESLMKCVEMGWLAILLGPQSSGKTSLVRLLAQMTGHSLCVLPMNSSMDTTELLGGFEQTDIWRHLGQAAHLTEAEVRRVESQCLVQGDLRDKTIVSCLESSLNSYRQLSQSSEGLPGEEVISLLSQHVKELQSLVVQLEKIAFHCSDTTTDLKLRLSSLHETVSSMKPGLGGGAFEWVDSILVKALTQGQWLLIDNVNFCSASVLDRLNALLEPGGVLSINERGTVDGDIVSIKPHPAFRLFFAMDPKRGEISRAMRNRGIEIYISGEDDGCPYTPYDLHSMLHGIGLSDNPTRTRLLAVHGRLQSQLSWTARPVVADLLQAAAVCSQLQTRGFGNQVALTYAIEDVYLTNQKSGSQKEVVRDIIQNEMCEELHLDETSMPFDMAATFDTYLHCLHASPVDSQLLSSAKQATAIVLDTMGNGSLSDVQIHTLACIFTALQSEHSQQFSFEWLQYALKTLAKHQPSGKSPMDGAIQQLTTLTGQCLNAVFDSPVRKELCSSLQQLFAGASGALTLLEDQPWDMTFNPQATARMTLQQVKATNTELTNQERVVLGRAESTIQRLQLSQQCVIISHILKDKLKRMEEIAQKGKQKGPVKTVLGLISLLLSQLASNLPALVASLADGQVAWLQQNVHHLKWLTRLSDVTTMGSIYHKDIFLSHMALRWQWAVGKLADIFTLDLSDYPKLAMSVEELGRKLGTADGSMKRYVKFWTSFGHPKPYLTSEEADTALRFKQMKKLMDLSVRSDTTAVLNSKVAAMEKFGSWAKMTLMRILSAMANGRPEDVLTEMEELSSTLVKAGLLKEDEVKQLSKRPRMEDDGHINPNEDTDVSLNTMPSKNVVLWPLFDHMVLKVGLYLATNRIRQIGLRADVDGIESMDVSDGSTSKQDEADDDMCQQIKDFSSSHTPSLAVWTVSQHSKQKDEILSCVTAFLDHLWRSCASRDSHVYLEWTGGLDEGVVINRSDVGPGILCNSPSSKFIMKAFASKSSLISSSSELLPLHISLGHLQQTLDQVALVARHTWCHSGTLVNQKYNESILSKEMLIHSFVLVLGSLDLGDDRFTWQSLLSSLSLGEPPNSVFAQLLSMIQSKQELLPPSILAVLSRCFEVIQEVWVLPDGNKLQQLKGHGFAYVGLILLHLVTPCGPVDPVQKAGIKLGYVTTEMSEIESELTVWDRVVFLRTGRRLEETHRQHLHPRVIYLMDRRRHLEVTKDTLSQRCAYRPDMTQYLQLTQTAQNFSANTCSVSRITDLVNKLTPALSNDGHDASVTAVTAMSALQDEETWQTTSERFLTQLTDKYPCFDDITQPVCLAVNQVKLGLRFMASHLNRTIKMDKSSKNISPPTIIQSLCQFPSVSISMPDLLTTANQRATRAVQEAVRSAFCGKEEGVANEAYLKGLNSKLLLSSLLLMKAHSLSIGRLDKNLVGSLMDVLDCFSTAWVEYQELERQRKAEKEALYRYKDETHGDERSEKEIDEAEFQAAYPSFKQDFIDVTGATTLEEVGMKATHEEEAEVEAQQMASDLLPMMTPAEMSTVRQIHQSVMTSLSVADWLEETARDSSCSDGGSQEQLHSLLMGYKLGSEVVGNTFDLSDNQVDSSIQGSHLLVAGSVTHYLDISGILSQSQISLESPKGKTYNFYFDPNLQEVMKCLPVIDSLSQRVAHLQQEWPNHPTLVLLNQIKDRILSFSVTSPVLKFLMGMELLLLKAQDWESNAASFVSMGKQLTEITTLIIQWRKLELSCWSSALDHEEEQCRQKASHWWFHLYRLVSDHINGMSGDGKTDKGESLDIVTSLKTFLEGSSLGEYSLRLDMMKAFHCQLIHMEATPQQQHLLHVTWNLHQFYHQFLPTVQEELKKARKPIDKQLKGFVKIARWSDLNYWSLKTSTEKTHRTVHKFMKQYQAVLRQPVKNLLGEKESKTEDQNSGFGLEGKMKALSVGITKQLDLVDHQQDSQEVALPSTTDDLPLLSRLPQLCQRMKSHVKKSWRKLKQTQTVDIFDSFTGELIEGIHELQNLEVDMTAEKEKQKSQAKAINLRKRKGLSELFKYLTFVGISYRKGMTGKKHKMSFASAIEQPPLNLTSSISPAVLSMWSGCNEYFYRCMTRHAHFIGAYDAPSKELGMAEIQRCFGFVEHLSEMYLDHRMQLHGLAEHTRDLRTKMAILTSLTAMKDKGLPPQADFKQWMERVSSLLTEFGQWLAQFSFILDACPCQHASVHPSPLPASSLSPSALWHRGDQAWTQCQEHIKGIDQTIKTEQDLIGDLMKKSVFGSEDVQSVLNCLSNLKAASPTMASIIQDFTEPGSQDPNCFVVGLVHLQSRTFSVAQGFEGWIDGLNERRERRNAIARKDTTDPVMNLAVKGDEALVMKKRVSEFETGVNGLVESLLLGVQNMAKLAAAKEEKEKMKKEKELAKMGECGGEGDDRDGEAGQEEEEQPELEDGHLSQHLLGMETSLMESIGTHKVTQGLDDLLTKLFDMTNVSTQTDGDGCEDFTPELSHCVSLLMRVRPLVNAYTLMTERQLGYTVAAHRCVGKLLAVLLAVFTELFQKGFCIPPELSDEMEGEGATEFKDIESGGLGEGEGAKDVSDQIESEDQLEEAKKPGSEEKEDKDQPDIPEEDNAIEMSEDIDGKMHNMDETEDIDEREDDEREKQEEELDKQMGEIDGEEKSERLDERMWGDDEEEEEDGEEEKEEKDEKGGGGMDKQKEELVAKDDNRDAADAKDEEEEEGDGKEEKKERQHKNEMGSDTEYDDDQVNPHNEPEKNEQPDPFELPDDLNLDDQDKGKEGDEDQEMNDDKDDEEGGDNGGEDVEEGGDDDHSDDKDEDIPQLEAGNDDEEEDDTGGKEEERQGKAEEEGNEEEEEEEEMEDGSDLRADKAVEEKEKEEEDMETDAPPEEEKPVSEMQRDKKDEKQTQDKADTSAEAAPTNNETEADDMNTQGEQVEEATQEEEQEERDATGLSSAEKQEGVKGNKSQQMVDDVQQTQDKQSQRNPGESNKDRTLGSKDKEHRKLKAKDTKKDDSQDGEDDNDDNNANESMNNKAKEYEHVKDAKESWDTQAVDVADNEQLEERQAIPNEEEEEGGEMEEDEDVLMQEDKEDEEEEASKPPEKRPSHSKGQKDRGDEAMDDEDENNGDDDAGKDKPKVEVEGERVLTMTVEGPPQSSVYTVMENLKIDDEYRDLDMETLRSELEGCVRGWAHPEDKAVAMAASEAWQKYLTITSSLSQELCEQLRLLLEPSLATKLKGDYRTGKRLNMRKVIPYIASQFRKDKIWLRRSKPSKRQYQIMMAVDDSSSMADNHTKQLAFESLALVSNALTLLESGELAICSFGEDVRLLHPFGDPFTNQSGATILQKLKCEQKQTKYGQLLDTAVALMQEAKGRQPSTVGNEETAQLLLILSDGHGVFREGMETVKRAVQKARAARIFVVFLVMDNPDSKGSILDSRVPIIDSSGKIGEIKTYLELFPFPFYIILRDINSMPHILSNALRQWFELVTAGDR